MCLSVKGFTVFQIHFSHLYGKWLEEDSKKGEEEAEESEITKALVLEPVAGRDHRVAGEPICDTDPSRFYGYQSIPETHTSWSVTSVCILHTVVISYAFFTLITQDIYRGDNLTTHSWNRRGRGSSCTCFFHFFQIRLQFEYRKVDVHGCTLLSLPYFW